MSDNNMDHLFMVCTEGTDGADCTIWVKNAPAIYPIRDLAEAMLSALNYAEKCSDHKDVVPYIVEYKRVGRVDDGKT